MNSKYLISTISAFVATSVLLIGTTLIYGSSVYKKPAPAPVGPCTYVLHELSPGESFSCDAAHPHVKYIYYDRVVLCVCPSDITSETDL